MYYVYMLLCSDDSLYTGITPNLQRRMRQHTGQLKGGARYTALRPPKELAAVWTAPDRSTASKAEYAIKQLSADRKRCLIAAPHWLNELTGKDTPLDVTVFPHPALQELLNSSNPAAE